jgi:hypothetical protein
MVTKKRSVISVFITLIIITMLILSGPVSAVQVGIGTPSTSTPGESSTVSFVVYVDIQTNERIPVQNLTLVIDDSGTDNLCYFLPDGTELSGPLCGNVTITQLYALTWANATNYYGYGYGYGYSAGSWSYGYSNTTFYSSSNGYGYGYTSGYSYSANTKAELMYNVSWTTPGVTANKTYNIYLIATVDDGSSTTSWRTYQNPTATQVTVVDNGALQGNVSDVDTTGITNLTIKINGSDDLTQDVSDILTVNFTDGNISIMNFDWNFTKSNLTLTTIAINKTFSNGSETLVISGLNLTAQRTTKIVYLNQTNTTLNAVCILDEDITSVAQMSADCSYANETKVECNGQAQSGYTCTDLGTTLKIEGLSYTGLRQISYTIPPTTSAADSGGTSSGSGISGFVTKAVKKQITAFDIIDIIREFYQGISKLTVWDIIDKIREFYEG